ncbi:uncharacterized protein LOC143148402 [Ptiloglossa arizonensis]|uniref:uncharacterized protein LOC143148402 n=1 Tax=Ptiloglossa arizonensis TaxID=3350558 RepID=UPI003FA006A2
MLLSTCSIQSRRIYMSTPHLSVQTQKSIMKVGTQNVILVADCNYVKFRNFKLNKLYKKKITLKNITTSPARFQIEARPYRSKFRVLIKPIIENKNIVPPGMQVQLIVLFRCDIVDQPEEILVLNVQDGKSLIIKLHGFKDPPILFGFVEEHEQLNILRDVKMVYSQSKSISTKSSSESNESGDEDVRTVFKSTILDCKKGFVGEEIHVPIKFKNVGGEGLFFVMSEIDWVSMHIEDVVNTNTLVLPSFTLRPVHFSMKPQQVMTLHVHFFPNCYGIHVDKLYILCDNCSFLATEIIGDGLIYEPNFIQLSKVSMLPFARSIIF